jgi:hypothetical protein
MLKNYILALLVFNLSACATVHSVPLPSPGTVPSSINIGDQVKVITLDGNKHKFAVTKIDITGIGRYAVFFPYTEIKSISVRQASSDSPYITAIVVGAVVLGLLALLASESLEDIECVGEALGCALYGDCGPC